MPTAAQITRSGTVHVRAPQTTRAANDEGPVFLFRGHQHPVASINDDDRYVLDLERNEVVDKISCKNWHGTAPVREGQVIFSGMALRGMLRGVMA